MMPNPPSPYAIDYADVERHHLPNLYKFVIPIAHTNAENKESLGSGLSVEVNGRHFVATARHCIENDPRVLLDRFELVAGRLLSTPSPRILNSGWHATLDVGFLELYQAVSREMKPEQFWFQQVPAGSVPIIGHPICRVLRDDEGNPTTIQKCSIGTEIMEQTDDYLKVVFPRVGVQFDDAARDFVQALFPESPEGFSGGGCFGINRTIGQLSVIDYKLLGIQYSWPEGGTGRWVKAIPIRRWCELLNERCEIMF